MKFSKGKFSKFMSSKGFYAAIAVCLLGAGAATWLAVNRTITSIEDSNSRLIQNDTSVYEFPLLEEAEKKQPDIPKVSTSSSLPSMPSSSSAPSSVPEEPAKPVEAPPPSPTLSYTLPLKGDISNQFSNGELVKNTTLNDWRTHDGIDITAGKGSEVCAAADGVVSEVKKDPLWGSVIVIRHVDGKESMYYGLSEVISVAVGENVLSKQVIGTLEGVPCELSEAPHLHFAMKQDGVWIDPLGIVARAVE